MSNIFVPINSSDLKEKIPVGEDIVYSTMAQGRSSMGNTSYKWSTHVLASEKGIAYRYYYGRRNTGNTYLHWSDIHSLHKRGIRVTKGTWLTPRRINEFETKDVFKTRKKEMQKVLLPYVIQSTQEKYVEIENDPSIKDRKKRKMRFLISSSISKLEKLENQS